MSCLTPGGGRYEACFPQWQDWLPGELAACAGLGDTGFVRWTITGQSADDQAVRRPLEPGEHGRLGPRAGERGGGGSSH
jgi:hypothetical protein